MNNAYEITSINYKAIFCSNSQLENSPVSQFFPVLHKRLFSPRIYGAASKYKRDQLFFIFVLMYPIFKLTKKNLIAVLCLVLENVTSETFGNFIINVRL